MTPSPERTLASQRLYRGKVVNLRVDTVELPGGRLGKREVVEHAGGVVIVPIDDQDNVLFVRQYRLPVAETLLELPAGGADPGEGPQTCASRELQEETGYQAGRLERLCGFYTAPGFCTEFLHLFLATELSPSPLKPDEDEAIELVRVPLAQVQGLIASGEIRDVKTIAGLLLALSRYRTRRPAP